MISLLTLLAGIFCLAEALNQNSYNSYYKVSTYYDSTYGKTTSYNYYYKLSSTSSGYFDYYSGSTSTNNVVVSFYAAIWGTAIAVCVLSSIVCLCCIYKNTRLRKHKSAPNSVGLEMNAHSVDGPNGTYPYSPRTPG